MSNKSKQVHSKQISMELLKKPINWLLSIRDIPPAQDSPQHILNILDDDCIYEIFRKFSTIEDVLNMALVCQRFQESAKRCIQTKFKCCIAIDGDKDYSRKFWKSKRIEETLSVFGSMIDSISFKSTSKLSASDDDYIFQSIAKFCGKTLKTLQLKNTKPNFDQTQFQALEQLYFAYCTPGNFKSGSSLKFLRIKEKKLNWVDKYVLGDRYKPWYLQKMPSLERIQFFQIDKLTENTLIKFLTLNPQLQGLTVLGRDVSISALKHIAQCSPNLLSLSFSDGSHVELTNRQIHENIMHCSQFRRLKHFELNVLFHPISLEMVLNMFAQNDVPIERLSIDLFREIDKCNNMLTLKTLKHLKILNFHGENIVELLINVVKTQIALKTIYVYQSLRIPHKIENILKYSKDLSQLKYKMDETKIYLKNSESVVSLCINRNKIIKFHNGKIDFTKNVSGTNGKWLEFDLLTSGYIFIFNNNVYYVS